MAYKYLSGNQTYVFRDLKDLMAKATMLRSGDQLAGIAAATEKERVIAKILLADVPLKKFLEEHLITYEKDEVTRLIINEHDANAFQAISHLTIGGFRDWLLSGEVTSEILKGTASGITPEMAAAVSKIMSIQDMVLVASKCEVITRFRNTLGLKGHFSTRLQPNHPFDDLKGIAASVVDGLLKGSGDAVIGINPATDSFKITGELLIMLDTLIGKLNIPTQSCVLAHLTTTMELVEKGYPVDLTFQSIAGSEKANSSFGINLSMLQEAHEATIALKRGVLGNNVMYFETGQGSALSAMHIMA